MSMNVYRPDVNRSEGFPAMDIWFLHTVAQGSYQMGRVVGTPPSPPPPSVGFTGGLSPPGPPPCLISKGADHQNVRSHTRMLGPSVFPDSNTEGLARGRVFRMLGPISECLVLQYLQIQILRISKGAGLQNVRSHTRMLGPSVFPDSQVIPECLVLPYVAFSSENIACATQI